MIANCKHWLILGTLVTSFGLHGNLHAQLDVFLDFGAGWESNLVTVATDAGVDPFAPLEIDFMEAVIESEFGRVLGFDFDITFFTTAPAGAHTIVDFGATTSSSTLLGSAPGDFFNVSVSDTASVFTHNFDFVVDEFTGSAGRSDQLSQLSMAIANTAIHELTHSLGNFHEHSYATPGINPGTYGDTMGLQNMHIMSTGPTGLTEAGREVPRTLSQFSKLALEAAGGLDGAIHGFTGVSLAPDVILFEDEYISSDAGKSIATAAPLTLTDMPISGYEAAHVHSDITGPADADFYALDVDSAGFVSAQMISERWPAGFGLDGVLTLFGPDELEIIAMDATMFDGDVYGMGTLRSTDPFLINVLLPHAGTYYFMVSGTPADSLGDYSLLIGFQAIPEPGSVVVLGGFACLVITRRRRNQV